MRILTTLTHLCPQTSLRIAIVVGIVLICLVAPLVSVHPVSAFPLAQAPLTISPTRASISPTPVPTRVSSALTPTREPNAPLPTPTGLLNLDPKTRMYTVENGDTLWMIAQRIYGNGAKYTLIQRANNLGDRAKLQTGMTLIIPPLEPEEIGGPLPAFLATREPTPSPVAQAAIVPPPAPTVSVRASAPTESTNEANTEPAKPAATKNPADPLVGYVVLALNMFSGLFFLAALLCSYMSFDIYWRSRGYAHRRRISSRIRAGLYT